MFDLMRKLHTTAISQLENCPEQGAKYGKDENVVMHLCLNNT